MKRESESSVSKILLKRLKQSFGIKGKIFLKNGFRYSGHFGECDDEYLEFYDYKDGIKVIPISELKDIEVRESDNGRYT